LGNKREISASSVKSEIGWILEHRVRRPPRNKSALKIMRLQPLVLSALPATGTQESAIAEMFHSGPFAGNPPFEALQSPSCIAGLYGGEGRNRTDECSFCRAVPYHLATPPPGGCKLTEFAGVASLSCRAARRNLLAGHPPKFRELKPFIFRASTAKIRYGF
jgi:hypothetical protein